MLGPASLRSHQPSKTTLRTYGSRGKRASTSGAPTGATGLFQWDRIENERKARLEQREQARRAEKIHEEAAAAADAELEAQLYSDPESDDGSTDRYRTAHPRPPAPASTTGKELRTGIAGDVFATNQDPGSGTESWSWSSSLERTDTESSIIGQEPPRAYPEAITSKSTRKVMFHEKPIFEEDQEDEDEDEGNGGDEVLFRTPSFQVLQKLKELPRPRPIEPRVNPFGFDVLSGTESRAGNEAVERRISPSWPMDEPSDTATKNPLLESPSTKRSLEIFNKRTQQLANLQRHREKEILSVPTISSDDTSMEIDPEHQRGTLKDSRRDVRGRSPEIVSMKHGGAAQIQSTLPPQDTLDFAPDPEVGRHQVVQDDCVDLALGKRMSNIQITPQRLHAKQRKTYSHDQASPSRPSAPSFLTALDDDDIAEEMVPRSMNLFLDRDVPKDEQEQDDFDELFRRARQNRKRSPLPSSPPSLSIGHHTGGRPASPPRVLLRNERVGSAVKLSTRHHTSKFERTASFRLPHQQDPKKRIYRSSSFEDLHNPFIDSSTYSTKQETPQTALLHIPSREPTPQQLVIQQLPPVTRPSTPSLGPNRQTSQEGPTPMPQTRPIRQIRSLKRPPAPLVSSRKSIFRPKVDDLLAISDQQFFEQFRILDSSTNVDNDRHQDPGKEQQQSKDERSASASILDFEAVLPECMVDTLTKIGEASYSEVFTVDLPIGQCRRQRRRGRPSTSKNQHDTLFELFQSPRLNNYVQESTEEDHHQSTSSSRDMTAKLVMKVMPFLHGESSGGDGHTTTDSEGSGRGRRTKGRRRSESTLLALEDIYREAMVSTQIMQDWKGFIGGFGTLIVKGKYPKVFLSAWDQFCEDNGTESERPDMYGDDQLYCIILLPYGGIDLEHCPLANWRQAWSILTQIASSLESKEQAPFWFEHRDLHWGNILVKGTRQDHILFPKRDLSRTSSSVAGTKDHDNEDQNDDNDGELFRKIPTCGIIVQMIDFTLARVQGDKGNLIYMDLEKDQDLFRGQGDYQFDIYRMMRKQINKDWAASCPRTNLFWLHYIADKLLTEKDLKKPTKRLQTSTTKDDVMEYWCYERVLAVSRMSLDRLDPSGKTPSATVLDLLLHSQPS